MTITNYNLNNQIEVQNKEKSNISYSVDLKGNIDIDHTKSTKEDLINNIVDELGGDNSVKGSLRTTFQEMSTSEIINFRRYIIAKNLPPQKDLNTKIDITPFNTEQFRDLLNTMKNELSIIDDDYIKNGINLLFDNFQKEIRSKEELLTYYKSNLNKGIIVNENNN